MFLIILLNLIARPDAVFLVHSAHVQYDDLDSTFTETTEEIVVPLTARGVQRYSGVTASYRSQMETIEVTASISHWRPGRGEEPAFITEDPHSGLLPSGRLESSLRELTVSFPGIEIGDTLRILIRRRIDRLPLGDYYSYKFYGCSRDSIHRAEFRVSWPENMDLFEGSSGEMQRLSEGPANGRRVITWTCGPRSPVMQLPFSAPIYSASPWVNISSHTPEQVSRGLYQVLDRNSMVDFGSSADSVISETGRAPRDICRWVLREIEYLGGDWGRDPGYSPRSPLETLEERVGVCRDKAVLLLWLLRSCGYDPYLVLTSFQGASGPLPGSRSFDHIMVAMDDPEGGTMFLDPTDGSSPAGFTFSLRGREYLPLTEQGSGLMRFPEISHGDSVSIQVQASLNLDSFVIEGTITAGFSGSAEELFRSMLRSVDRGSLNLLMERLFGMIPGSHLSTGGDPMDIEAPLEISGTGQWRCTAGISQDTLYLILPGLESLDLVSARAGAFILPGFRDDIYVETPYRVVLSLKLTGIPPGLQGLPEPLQSDNYSIDFTLLGDTLEMREALVLQPLMPDSAQLAHLRTALACAISPVNRTLRFR